MTGPQLVPIEPPTMRPEVTRAYAVLHRGQIIGQVLLIPNRTPTGQLRASWRATATVPEPRQLPRPFKARHLAAEALAYQFDHPLTKPPGPPPDETLTSIKQARDTAGPAAALWLAASLAVHHITELEANRTTTPPALWHELRRLRAWLQAATAGAGDRLSPYQQTDPVDYRNTNESRGLYGPTSEQDPHTQ